MTNDDNDDIFPMFHIRGIVKQVHSIHKAELAIQVMNSIESGHG